MPDTNYMKHYGLAAFDNRCINNQIKLAASLEHGEKNYSSFFILSNFEVHNSLLTEQPNLEKWWIQGIAHTNIRSIMN